MARPEKSEPAPSAPDGRALRWAGHNERRRAELVQAALVAIRTHGSDVGLETIARVAGTRKPALYRHFGDRVGLYAAVAAEVSANIDNRLRGAIADGGTLETVLRSLTDGYLALAERDPEVYRYVVSPPQVAGAVAEHEVQGIANRAIEVVTSLLAERSHHPGVRVWATAIVGAIQNTADAWLAAPHQPPRAEVVADLVDLLWRGLASKEQP